MAKSQFKTFKLRRFDMLYKKSYHMTKYSCVYGCLHCLISDRLCRCKLNLWIQYHWPTYHWPGLFQGVDFGGAGLIVERRQGLSWGTHIRVALGDVKGVLQGCLRSAPAVRLERIQTEAGVSFKEKLPCICNNRHRK